MKKRNIPKFRILVQALEHFKNYLSALRTSQALYEALNCLHGFKN